MNCTETIAQLTTLIADAVAARSLLMKLSGELPLPADLLAPAFSETTAPTATPRETKPAPAPRTPTPKARGKAPVSEAISLRKAGCPPELKQDLAELLKNFERVTEETRHACAALLKLPKAFTAEAFAEASGTELKAAFSTLYRFRARGLVANLGGGTWSLVPSAERTAKQPPAPAHEPTPSEKLLATLRPTPVQEA
jgi:hypothetical protein